MGKDQRIELIQKIEEIRGSKVLCYLTGDRRHLETRIHPEVHSMFYDHLQALSPTKQIDLYLYSTGGVTMAAWSLVNLIREFCDKFCVIVPFKAVSTATLVALGADEILMGRLGQLGPVDPSVTMPFNPPAPGGQPGQVIPISVEEVASFIKFSKDEKFIGLKSEDSIAEVLKLLADEVHPLALGSVYRATEQIAMLSRKLLSFHMPPEEDKEIEAIVNSLTRELYSHDYIINRREAKEEIKLKVIEAENVSSELEKSIYDLYTEYEDAMELNRGFVPEIFLGDKKSGRATFYRAFIESKARTDSYLTERHFRKVEITPPGETVPTPTIQQRDVKEGWEQL